MSAIVEFYRGSAPDYRGRYLRDIWEWDFEHLEYVHSYIQILFPNAERSFFNPVAPLLDRESIETFRNDQQLRNNLAISFDVILRFYGMRHDEGTNTVLRNDDFAERAANWLTPWNHNFLRITRILKCLVTLGLPKRAHAFFAVLHELYATNRDAICDETFAYWQDAVSEQERASVA